MTASSVNAGGAPPNADTTWSALESVLTPAQILDLLLLAGWYQAISFAANAARRSAPVSPDTVRAVRTIGNLLWLVLSGFWMAVGYALAGLLMCITLIGIPFGVQSFKLAAFSLWPFGRVVVIDRSASAAAGCLGNVLWFVFAGWWLALGHVLTGILLCLTILGIPLGLANFKLVSLALVPFGKTVVPVDRIAGREVWTQGPQPIR